MDAPYDQDLRLRVLSAIDEGMSKMKAHHTFRVARSTIDDWLVLRSQTGSVAVVPAARRGPSPAISDLVAFEEFAVCHCHKAWPVCKTYGSWKLVRA